MRIERIDDKTIKCFISNEELEEYEISYKDFVMRSDKAREMIEDIMEQAGEEVDYHPPKFAFELQIMVLPDQGMILTFSEKGPEDMDPGKELMECLRQLKDIVGKNLPKTGAEEGRDTEPAQKTGKSPAKAAPDTGDKADEGKREGTAAMFAFGELRRLMEYAAVLPEEEGMHSVLYKLGDKYYLYLEIGEASYEYYSRACIRGMEFGELYSAGEERTEYIREHGDCLIGEKALAALKGKL